MDSAEHDDGISRIDPAHIDPRELHHDIGTARCQQPGAEPIGRFDIVHLLESVSAQQLLGHILWRHAN
jgi:hypothetical protein